MMVMVVVMVVMMMVMMMMMVMVLVAAVAIDLRIQTHHGQDWVLASPLTHRQVVVIVTDLHLLLYPRPINTSLRSDSPVVPNVLLVFRTFANLFSSPQGATTSLMKYREKIIEQMQAWISCSNKNVRVSLCTVLLNYSVLLRKQPDLEAQTQCLSTLATILQSETDNEAQFRSLVAVGNL
ncbi:hypothetical protein QZH41_008411, partial [Actinostola sp. cb2023]